MHELLMWCKGGLTGNFLSEKSFLLQIAFLSLIGVGAGGPGGPWPWPPHQIWKSVNPFSTRGRSRLYPPHYILICNVAFPCTDKYMVFHAHKEARGVVTVCIVRDHLNMCYHLTEFSSVSHIDLYWC